MKIPKIDKTLLLLLVAVVLIIIYGYISTTRLPSGTTGPAISPTAIPPEQYPPVSIQSVTNQTQNTVFTINVDQKHLPKEVNVYVSSAGTVIPVGESLAASFNIRNSPTVINGVYYWDSNDVHISAQENPPSVSYSTSRAPKSSGNISDADALKSAESFLRNNKLLSSSVDVTPVSVQRITAGGGHPEPASAGTAGPVTIIVTYQLRLGGFPICDTTGGEYRMSVWVITDGSVQRASAPIFPAMNPTQKITLIPAEQALVALSNNRAVLTRVQEAGITVSSSRINPTVKTATITSMELAYVWDRTKRTLLPVYIFTGESKDEGALSKTLLLTYFLAATTEQSGE